jgi:hypothetical protein
MYWDWDGDPGWLDLMCMKCWCVNCMIEILVRPLFKEKHYRNFVRIISNIKGLHEINQVAKGYWITNKVFMIFFMQSIVMKCISWLKNSGLLQCSFASKQCMCFRSWKCPALFILL